MAASPQQVNGRGWNGSWTPPPSCSAAGYFVTLLSALLHFRTKFDTKVAPPIQLPFQQFMMYKVLFGWQLPCISIIHALKHNPCHLSTNQLSPRLRNNEAMNHNLCSSISNEWTTTNIPLFHLVSHSKEEEDASPLGPHFTSGGTRETQSSKVIGRRLWRRRCDWITCRTTYRATSSQEMRLILI